MKTEIMIAEDGQAALVDWSDDHTKVLGYCIFDATKVGVKHTFPNGQSLNIIGDKQVEYFESPNSKPKFLGVSEYTVKDTGETGKLVQLPFKK